MRTALSPTTAGKLFVTGFTVGPIVDSLHNQCLLKYNVLPISIERPSTTLAEFLSADDPYLFCSSWTVPPLLGVAYVVLGGILPRIFEYFTTNTKEHASSMTTSPTMLRNKAILAVITTAMIIKLSEYLETHPHHYFLGPSSSSTTTTADENIMILLIAALTQWIVLDGSLSALLSASITSIGGPLSELPFVGYGVWEYLDSSKDHFPLQNVQPNNPLLSFLLNDDNYSNLGLSSITGPCYFAVTMDAIALGRWFDSSTTSHIPDPTIDDKKG
jgi:hypothetical protein